MGSPLRDLLAGYAPVLMGLSFGESQDKKVSLIRTCNTEMVSQLLHVNRVSLSARI